MKQPHHAVRPRLLRTTTTRALQCVGAAFGLLSLSGAQALGPLQAFPGDTTTSVATGNQEEVALAAGGPGYLAVWEDQRANLAGFTGAVGHPAAGNLTDLYAARYDAAGNLLDTTPILVTQMGHNQTDPVVAWNGENWLVVFVTQRPDWYFYEDIVGVRIAPDGSVLDPVPIQIRPESGSPANDYGQNPSVASNGTDWLVVWEAYDPSTSEAIVQGARIAQDGTVLDPAYVTLYQFGAVVFGPEFPQAASVNGEYMLVWNDFGPVRARRFDSALNPLGSTFTIPGLAGDTRVAASDTGYFVLATLGGVRLAANGTILDATPIDIPAAAPIFAQSATVQRPELAWSGTDWAITYSLPVTGSLFDDDDVWLVRVAPDGTVVDAPPLAVDASTRDDTKPVIAGGGDGGLFFAYQSGSGSTQSLDVRTSLLNPTGAPVQIGGVASLGLPRQEHISWVRGPGVHLALFTSRVSGTTQVLGQRFDDAGNAIDAQPSLIHQGSENLALAPRGAWNGTNYFVVWWDATGLVLGRRLTPELAPIGFGATPVMQGMDGPPDVGALGNDFLVVASQLFSGDQRHLEGIRVSGTTGAPLDATPILVAFNYSSGPRVVGLGDHWLVAYTHRGCHDCNTDRIRAVRIGPDGVPAGSSFVVNGPGEGAGASVAVAGDRALVTYSDSSAFLQESIEGRLLASDGSFLGDELLICDEAGRQLFPSAGFDGTEFVVAWSDYREIQGVEQSRADIYAARVTIDGTLLDPAGGIPVAVGLLPQDYPAVSSGAAPSLIAFLELDGANGNPEVQRVHYRTLGDGAECQEDLGFGGPGTAAMTVCATPLQNDGFADLAIDSDQPFAPVLLGWGLAFNPTPVLGGTFVAMPPAAIHAMSADANGDVWLPGLQPLPFPLTVYAQAAIVDATQPAGFQLSNAVKLVFAP